MIFPDFKESLTSRRIILLHTFFYFSAHAAIILNLKEEMKEEQLNVNKNEADFTTLADNISQMVWPTDDRQKQSDKLRESVKGSRCKLF